MTVEIVVLGALVLMSVALVAYVEVWKWRRRRAQRLAFRRLTKAFQDVAAAIGEGLVPAMRGAVAGFTAFGEAFNALPEEVRQALRNSE